MSLPGVADVAPTLEPESRRVSFVDRIEDRDNDSREGAIRGLLRRSGGGEQLDSSGATGKKKA